MDDEGTNRQLMRNLLESNGHRVYEAIDGKEALERVAEHDPDVVVLDVMMPQIDGFEVCRRLTKSYSVDLTIDIKELTRETD